MLVAKAVREVRATPAERPGYVWSGGKDSQALRVVMEQVGIARCAIATSVFDYSVIMDWVRENAPEGLEYHDIGVGYKELLDDNDRLFMKTKKAKQWWLSYHLRSYKSWAEQNDIDICFTGRRKIDGNNAKITVSHGVQYYSPLWDWSHEEVMACNKYHGMASNPIYEWGTGWMHGTTGWATRFYKEISDDEYWWRELWVRDPDKYREARTAMGLSTERPTEEMLNEQFDKTPWREVAARGRTTPITHDDYQP